MRIHNMRIDEAFLGLMVALPFILAGTAKFGTIYPGQDAPAQDYQGEDYQGEDYNGGYPEDYTQPEAPGILPAQAPIPLPRLVAHGRVILTPEGVEIALEEQGFIYVHRVVYTGAIYTALARGPRGYDVSLRVDASTGEVLWPHYYIEPYYYGPYRGVAPLAAPLPPAAAPPPVVNGRYAPRRAPGPALMTFDRVRFALERVGFTEIAEAGYEDGVFRVEGRNRSGEYVRLVVDAYTGEVIYERVVSSFDDPWSREFSDFSTVRRQLVRDLYTNIQGVRVEDDFILVDAENRHGDEVRLMVDRRTGRVLKTVN
jgi:uncharacterized membrane protein YkoI